MVSFCHFNFMEQHYTLIHYTHIQLVLLLMFFYNLFLLLCLIEIRLSILCTLYNIRFIFCKMVFNTLINLVTSKHEIKQHHETEIHQTSWNTNIIETLVIWNENYLNSRHTIDSFMICSLLSQPNVPHL